MNGKLILFPVTIGAEDISISLPEYNLELLNTCHTFIVEEVRTARRFLKKACYQFEIDDTTFLTLNEHTRDEDILNYLDPITKGENIGLLSEAGLPCIADPGAKITRLAQQHGYEIVPLVGPSSLLLALMASGFNGQNFAFVGYIPVKGAERRHAILQLETRAYKENQTQIFIEAPYRNNQMLADLSETLNPHTLICIATDITLPTQQIITRTAAQWKKTREQVNLHKRNTVFLIYK
ncbi:MAG: SAM-dependent methyltransferase [Bacteroidales bacterium]|nr:SAM-dependent methyltransferase [Bacteroidales bacterium]